MAKDEDELLYSKAVEEVESILHSPSTIKRQSRGDSPRVGKSFEEIRPKSPRGLPAVGKAFEDTPKSPSGLAAVGKAFMAVVSALDDDAPRTPRKRYSMNGYCIRCGKEMDYDPDRPLCLNDFVKWNEYKDIDYPENFCHGCGNRRKVSMGKPLCRACYREDREDDD